MPGAKSHYHRQPGSNATEKQEFRGLVQELRRLAFEHRYTRSDLASELGISLPTLNQWLSGYIQLARAEHVERLKRFLNRAQAEHVLKEIRKVNSKLRNRKIVA
jgi:transcriptional regulator with XRE-family HTH domain